MSSEFGVVSHECVSRVYAEKGNICSVIRQALNTHNSRLRTNN
jgi:hypothetical protein